MTYRNRYLSVLFGLGIYLLMLGAMLFTWMAIFYHFQYIWEQVLIIFLACFMALYTVYCAKSLFRDGLSTFRIDSRGVKNSYIFGRSYLITWEECKRIGIANFSRGWGYYNYVIYFAKKPFPYKYLREMQKLKNSQNHIWLMFSHEALEEVLKYVEKGRIKGLGKVPSHTDGLHHNLSSTALMGKKHKPKLLLKYIALIFLVSCVLFGTFALVMIFIYILEVFERILVVLTSPAIYVPFIYTIVETAKHIKKEKHTISEGI